MLSSKQLQRERGGCHASATGATGPGDPWAKRLGDDHRARRRCGPAHWTDDQDGLAGDLGPAYPSPLDATGAQLGGDGGELVGFYPRGSRSPDGVSRSLLEGLPPPPYPSDAPAYGAVG